MVLSATPNTVAAWVVIVLSQCAAVVGDAFGQRTVRVVHKHSRRRMIMSFVAVSAVQVLLVLGLLQIVLPPSITGAVYIDGQPSTCYVQYFDEGCCPSAGPSCSCVVNCTAAASQCQPAPCPSQGPGSMFRSLQQHPFLLINGVANTVYYFAESMLYREPLGLVFLVVASLSATVFFKPVGAVFHLPNSSIAPGVLALGVGGALLCIVEKVQCSKGGARRRRTGSASGSAGPRGGAYPLANGAALYDSSVELEFGGDAAFGSSMGGSSALAYTQLAPVARGSFDVTNTPSKPTASFSRTARTGCGYVMTALRILPAFLVLSLCYCLWFVFMRFFNDLYRVNAWGFNSYDQVTLPFFVFPVMIGLSLSAPLRGLVETTSEGKSETFVQSFKHAMRELTQSWGSFFTVFTYRGIINLRAVVYSYLAIFYDLDVVYVELTLVRVITSWIGAIILCTCVPTFINTRPEERKRILAPINLLFKAAGTACVTASLFLLS